MTDRRTLTPEEKEQKQKRVWAIRQKWLNMMGAIASLFAVVSLGEYFVNECLMKDVPTIRLVMRGLGVAFWVVVLIYYMRLLYYQRKH